MISADQVKFFLKQRLVGFEVPSSPHFDSSESIEWFASKLKNSKKRLPVRHWWLDVSGSETRGSFRGSRLG